MDNMEDKLGAILQNPQLMQQIIQIAQSVGAPQAPADKKPAPQKCSPPEPDFGGVDPSVLAKIAGLAGKSRIDANQKALLCALKPYISQSRIEKLERALRATRFAEMADDCLGSGGIRLLFGR